MACWGDISPHCCQWGLILSHLQHISPGKGTPCCSAGRCRQAGLDKKPVQQWRAQTRRAEGVSKPVGTNCSGCISDGCSCPAMAWERGCSQHCMLLAAHFLSRLEAPGCPPHTAGAKCWLLGPSGLLHPNVSGWAEPASTCSH